MHGGSLTLHPAGRHGARVAAHAFCTFALFIGLVGHINEFRAQRLDLLLHCRTHIRGFYHCAQPFGGGNCLQTGNACTQD